MNGPTTGKQHTPFLPRKEDGNEQFDGTPHAPFSSPWKSTLLGGTQLRLLNHTLTGQDYGDGIRDNIYKAHTTSGIQQALFTAANLTRQ